MSSPSDDEQLGLVLGLVFALVVLLIGFVLAVVLARPHPVAQVGVADGAAPPAAVAVVPAAVPSTPEPAPAPSAQSVSDAASITVEYGVVKFYFASGKTALAPGASEALVDVVRAAKGGKKVQIAGFHDPQGNAAANIELARKRATAVRDALKEAGVAEGQITLQEPEQTAGSGNDAEARRVEITLQ